MRITDDIRRYLAGAEFSSGLRVPIVEAGDRVHDRTELLVGLARGKSVVHVGCVDHLPLLDAKIAAGTWLHRHLADAASRCVGIDINREGIERLRTRHGRVDVVAGDLIRDDVAELAGRSWDVFILADMLEHLDSPVDFLAAILARHRGRVGELVVTVPNAFCADNRRLSPRGIEYINTDHRFWFTPFTLAKVARRAGWDPRWIAYAENLPPSRLGRWRRRLHRGASPALADTIVLGMAAGDG